MSIKELEDNIKVCTLCRLCKSRKNAVPGEGNYHAKILFVGEAPGRREDEEGRPFVGNAGRLLDYALSKANIKREDVYITNIVKCRPPNNRVPLSDEIEQCIPYLEKQIKIIDPLIICILGRTAYHALLKGNSILANRGKVINYNGRNYFITLHPASAIYNPSLREVLINDIIKLASILNNLKADSLEGYI